MIKVGNLVKFRYNGKVRYVKVESVETTYFKGWDYTVTDTCEGYYRTFRFTRIQSGIVGF